MPQQKKDNRKGQQNSKNRSSSKMTNSTPTPNAKPNGKAIDVNKEKEIKEGKKLGFFHVAPALVDLGSILGLVYGGCCSNVMVYEKLLMMNPKIGSALTFCQMLFVVLQTLPSAVEFSGGYLPRLKQRQVPITQWLLQVVVLTTGSLLNNWSYAYNVSLPVLIIFRSAGLPISMLLSFILLSRRYEPLQIISVLVVTIGAILSALSSSTSTFATFQTAEDMRLYTIGIGMLSFSLLCTAFLGLLQEQTYKKYGPVWREALFYTHLLGLPTFAFLGSDVKRGLLDLATRNQSPSTIPYMPYMILLANLFSQYLCISGVNQLSSRVSSVSTNIALTTRKALSLCLSVWWFDNPWNLQLGAGASMVFLGSLLYTTVSSKMEKR